MTFFIKWREYKLETRSEVIVSEMLVIKGGVYAMWLVWTFLLIADPILILLIKELSI